jgi:hypothetical protein
MNEVIVWGSVYLGRPFVERIMSESTNTTTLIIAGVASIAVLVVLVYLSLRIDWEKVIGRWFPWALKNGDEKDTP